jgi:hypothetical protein
MGIADVLFASLRAKRSNPSHGITDGWIASSLAPLRKRFAFVADNDDVSMRFIHAKTKCPAQGRA